MYIYNFVLNNIIKMTHKIFLDMFFGITCTISSLLYIWVWFDELKNSYKSRNLEVKFYTIIVMFLCTLCWLADSKSFIISLFLYIFSLYIYGHITFETVNGKNYNYQIHMIEKGKLHEGDKIYGKTK